MKTNNILILTSLATAFIDIACVSGEKASQHNIKNLSRPNIVLIMADDMGYGDIGCFGSDSTKTPVLDKLAAEGVRFTDFHTNGAVSTPTRAALLTGNYQQRAGLESVLYAGDRKVGLDQKEITLAEVFKQNGYSTGIFGKWHLGFPPESNPVKQGFDEFYGYLSGNVDYISHRDGSNLYDWWYNTDKTYEKGYTTDLITDFALQFIEKNKNHPFFLYIPHAAPHYPYQGRNDSADRLLGKKFNDRGSRVDKVKAYREMIEVMDEDIGRILQKLKDDGLENNTLVFFCSDNGAYSPPGSNGILRGEKGSFWEGGHRVPAIARYPGKIVPGSICKEMILIMDLFPTFLSAAGIKDRPETDGIDISKALFSNKHLSDRTVFWRSKDKKAVRNGSWKYLEMNKKEYLFNLDDDIIEQNNLIEKKPEMVKRMKNDLKKWETTMNKYIQKSEH